MKLLCYLTFLMSAAAFAVPVLNQNMAADGSLTVIWPDHEDANHFYIAPSSIRLAGEANAPSFSLKRYQGDCRFGRCRVKGMINSLLIPDYEGDDLKRAQAGILKLRPAARFSTIPMFDGRVQFTRTLKAFIDQSDCSPLTGLGSDEIPCSLTLNGKGLNTLVPFLADGKVLVFQFVYTIRGVNMTPMGLKESSTNYGVAVKFGGEMLKDHSELRI